jgi:hypothetical protein
MNPDLSRKRERGLFAASFDMNPDLSRKPERGLFAAGR